ncbi:MAG: response regulator [Planctomycetes bacterium]|nr:response regulator [Planctomycetota bacterium]MCH9724771.1 response regulator [Planctomycetota bacterium]MCH9778711.1 response regulator [Planctomycetota bacterium]MDF1746975.1 response regulator [Gimesia sp.]
MNRLLIVDDALIMRMKIKEIAVQAGWTVVAEATNGEEAIALYEKHLPELVTLDMIMPKMDGLMALKTIRDYNPQAQVVMVSAVDQKEKLKDCIMNGAMDFIVKPFDSDRLLAFFERYRKD